MRSYRTAVVALVTFFGLSSPAMAVPIVLDFEGLGDQEPVLNFYNGGTGGSGSGPGPSHGIVFGSTALALIDADSGGTGNFANEPSPDTILFFLAGSAVMNVPAGFDTGFSFFYATLNFPGSVDVYDGLNASGTKITTLPLPVLPCELPGDPNGPYNCWTPVGVTFPGTAFSVDFSGTANQIGFDNITLGSEVPGGAPVPEPATLLLLSVGLGATGVAAHRKRGVNRRGTQEDDRPIV